jgi:hypothetical protein
MMQVSDAQISKIRQQISRNIAFPEEMSSAFDEGTAHEFLDDVIRCGTEEDLVNFIALLPRRRLNDLFGAILVMSAAAGETVFLRLLEILRVRITPSLAETGWAFYQHNYPNDRMSRVLSTIVCEFAEKGSEMPYLQMVAQVSDLPVIDENLPERIAKRLIQKPGEPLSDVLVKMTIMPDSPFAVTLLAYFFMNCPDEAIRDNADLFIHACRINGEQEQIGMIDRFYSVERLQPEWESINLAMLELFGPPRSRQQQKLASLLGHSSDARLWDHLDLGCIDRYRRWHMIYQLSQHIGENTRKKFFYAKYQNQILELSKWDEKTLVISFDGFFLADNVDDEDRIFYYDVNTYQMLNDGNHSGVFLNRPTGKVLTARQAQLAGDKNNIVCLQLDQVNLLYSRDFLTERLSYGKGSQQ